MAGEVMPPEAAAPAAEGPGDFQAFVSQLSQGLGILAEQLGSQSPEAGQAVAGLNDQLVSIIEQVLSGGGAAAQGVTSPEAGASGAQPASPAGVR